MTHDYILTIHCHSVTFAYPTEREGSNITHNMSFIETDKRHPIMWRKKMMIMIHQSIDAISISYAPCAVNLVYIS